MGLAILVVEDEVALAELWKAELGRTADVTTAPSLAAARDRLARGRFDLVLLDVNLPDGCGLDLLQELVTAGADADVIVTTAHADVPTAVRALRLGARDLLTKPCRLAELEQHVARAARERTLRQENEVLRRAASGAGAVGAAVLAPGGEPGLIGRSERLTAVRRLIARVAPTRTSVLIQGETGTGKEVAARMIHAQSDRADQPFVAVNCAALPPHLAESELFGHRKGAFTGADRDHGGVVRAASGGTLFLDEVGDMPAELQAKLLRLLESGEARRVGDAEPYRCSVRVVAATNRDLRQQVTAGRFREDLYYRLATFELRLPPLRTIPEDLPAIAQHQLETIVVPGSPARTLSADALDAMRRYAWPGNVRELRNVIERAKILADGPDVPASALSIGGAGVGAAAAAAADATGGPIGLHAVSATDLGADAGPVMTIADMEWRLVRRALAAHKGNKTAAARALGISLRTLYNKLGAHATPVQAAAA